MRVVGLTSFSPQAHEAMCCTSLSCCRGPVRLRLGRLAYCQSLAYCTLASLAPYPLGNFFARSQQRAPALTLGLPVLLNSQPAASQLPCWPPPPLAAAAVTPGDTSVFAAISALHYSRRRRQRCAALLLELPCRHSQTLLQE
jgi:hypothetical protein